MLNLSSYRMIIVCPSFCDEDNISILYDSLSQNLKSLNWCFVIIDDGTHSPIESFFHGGMVPDNCRLIGLPYNVGHQKALTGGLRQISYEISDDSIVVTLDSDGEDRPEDISKLMEKLSDNTELALASRRKRQVSFSFKINYFVFRWVFFLLTGKKIKSGNFAAMTARFLKTQIFHPNFNYSYSATLIWLNVPKAFVECDRGRRYLGNSKMNTLSLVIHGFEMLTPFLEKICVRMMIVLSSMFVFCVSTISLIISLRLFTDLPIPGWTTLVTLLLIVLATLAASNVMLLFFFFTMWKGRQLADKWPHGYPPVT